MYHNIFGYFPNIYQKNSTHYKRLLYIFISVPILSNIPFPNKVEHMLMEISPIFPLYISNMDINIIFYHTSLYYVSDFHLYILNIIKIFQNILLLLQETHENLPTLVTQETNKKINHCLTEVVFFWSQSSRVHSILVGILWFDFFKTRNGLNRVVPWITPCLTYLTINSNNNIISLTRM